MFNNNKLDYFPFLMMLSVSLYIFLNRKLEYPLLKRQSLQSVPEQKLLPIRHPIMDNEQVPNQLHQGGEQGPHHNNPQVQMAT